MHTKVCVTYKHLQTCPDGYFCKYYHGVSDDSYGTDELEKERIYIVNIGVRCNIFINTAYSNKYLKFEYNDLKKIMYPHIVRDNSIIELYVFRCMLICLHLNKLCMNNDRNTIFLISNLKYRLVNMINELFSAYVSFINNRKLLFDQYNILRNTSHIEIKQQIQQSNATTLYDLFDNLYERVINEVHIRELLNLIQQVYDTSKYSFTCLLMHSEKFNMLYWATVNKFDKISSMHIKRARLTHCAISGIVSPLLKVYLMFICIRTNGTKLHVKDLHNIICYSDCIGLDMYNIKLYLKLIEYMCNDNMSLFDHVDIFL
jgi:hypothetical protein